jgi:lipoate-protein ligase A
VRGGGTFLQHGSLLIDIDPVRAAAAMGIEAASISRSTTTLGEQLGRRIESEELARILRGAFEDTLGIHLAEAVLTGPEEALKQELLAGKYGTDRWNLEGKSISDENRPLTEG